MPGSFLTTITLSDDNYAVLLLRVQKFYDGISEDAEILTSQFISDRYSKKAYYFAVLRMPYEKGHAPEDAQPLQK